MHRDIVLSANIPWVIYNFRLELIRELINNDFSVSVIACSRKYFNNDKQYISKIINEGCKFYHVNIDFMGTNPLKDFKTFINYLSLYKKIKPDIILNYTIKPNIYGTLAARLLRIKVINNISGLGTLYIKQNLYTKIATILYKFSQRYASKIFFQNKDDLFLFTKSYKLVDIRKVDLLPGSGIDTTKYTPVNNNGKMKRKNEFNFIVVARMLRDKGIEEYVQAARILKSRYENINFQLLGFLESENKSAITKAQMDNWVSEKLVTYLGSTNYVIKYYNNADCVVLPSYREGIPRSLLEAASLEKPIITTDVPGCRDVIDDGINGFLCKMKNPIDLANKMEKMLQLNNEERAKMGKRGREKICKEFNVDIVIKKYLQAIEEAIENNTRLFRRILDVLNFK